MKKRLFIVLMIALLCCSAVFANGDDEKASSSNLPKKTVGVVYSTFTDALGGSFKASLESLASYFNIDFQFVETGYNTEEAQALIDALLQKGIDGLIAVSPSVSILDSAKKAGTAVIGLNDPVDEATAVQFAAYSNYIGAIVNNDYRIGEEAAKVLYEAGCRKICVTYLTPGTAKNHDDRYKGFMDTVKAKYPDMKILAENASRAKWSAAINTFAAAYPEMDGMFMTACNESAYQAIKKNGLVGKVVIATADISESTIDYLENGTIKMIAGGQYNKIMLAFAALYNFMYDGTRIIQSPTNSYATPFIFVENAKDFEDYQKYIDVETAKSYVYSPEYIASLVKGLNPDLTPAQFEKVCDQYSLADVVSRMGK
ncbi:MAG: sugar ABC transporter substrate-binding protein [Spirochaetales bacterium]|nr:sugar ABC transporter substrate-binding protein [Spirochaetales bacterium]